MSENLSPDDGYLVIKEGKGGVEVFPTTVTVGRSGNLYIRGEPAGRKWRVTLKPTENDTPFDNGNRGASHKDEIPGFNPPQAKLKIKKQARKGSWFYDVEFELSNGSMDQLDPEIIIKEGSGTFVEENRKED